MRLGGSRFIGLALVLRSIAPRHAVIRVAAFRGCTAASDPGCRVSVGGREDSFLPVIGVRPAVGQVDDRPGLGQRFERGHRVLQNLPVEFGGVGSTRCVPERKVQVGSAGGGALRPLCHGRSTSTVSRSRLVPVLVRSDRRSDGRPVKPGPAAPHRAHPLDSAAPARERALHSRAARCRSRP